MNISSGSSVVTPSSSGALSGSAKVAIALSVLGLAGVPVFTGMTDNAYVLTLVTRILIFALAAVGLNIALGFGGMVSFGHAMYVGLGAYTVLVLQFFGIESGVLHLLGLLLIVGLVALVVGLIALRTHGIAFIMITLAFAQLFYFLFVSLRVLGGDEGMTLPKLSQFGSLTNSPTARYYAVLACLLVVVYGTHRLLGSRFGLVLRATRLNERRVKAVGTSTRPYRLLAYVLSALVCAMAGFFLANQTGFVSPAFLAWTLSGELIVMVVLGGVGTVIGPVLGAGGLLLIEELLKSWTGYWMMVVGPLIILIVLGLRGGLWGMVAGRFRA